MARINAEMMNEKDFMLLFKVVRIEKDFEWILSLEQFN